MCVCVSITASEEVPFRVFVWPSFTALAPLYIQYPPLSCAHKEHTNSLYIHTFTMHVAITFQTLQYIHVQTESILY